MFSLSIHGALSITAPLRCVLVCLSSVSFQLTTSISLHCVLFCSATFRFGDRLWAGVLCFRISDTPKQAHLPSLDPAATFRYSPRHSIALHSSRQPPLHLSASTPLHSIPLSASTRHAIRTLPRYFSIEPHPAPVYPISTFLPTSETQPPPASFHRQNYALERV